MNLGMKFSQGKPELLIKLMTSEIIISQKHQLFFCDKN